MYDFSKIYYDKKPLSYEEILREIGSEAILSRYLGEIKIGVSIKSILRKDSNPSTSFFRGKDNQIFYHDYALGKTWNCFSLLRDYWGCSMREVRNRILDDFYLGEHTPIDFTPIIQEHQSTKKPRHTLIQFKPKPWTKKALKYWKDYEITKKELEREEVYLIDELYINKNIIPSEGLDRFAYLVRDDKKVYVKVYTPHSKINKWMSNIPLSVPFNLNTLEKGGTLYITKAKKDLIILKKLFKNVIATQNENIKSLKSSLIKSIKEDFSRVIVIFDNDPTGLSNLRKFKEIGFDTFHIPIEERERFNIKDIADYAKFYSVDILQSLFIKENLL